METVVSFVTFFTGCLFQSAVKPAYNGILKLFAQYILIYL
jgi:hypothetical protein